MLVVVALVAYRLTYVIKLPGACSPAQD